MLKFGGKSIGFGGKVQPAIVIIYIRQSLKQDSLSARRSRLPCRVTRLKAKPVKIRLISMLSGPIGSKELCSVIRLSQQGEVYTSGSSRPSSKAIQSKLFQAVPKGTGYLFRKSITRSLQDHNWFPFDLSGYQVCTLEPTRSV